MVDVNEQANAAYQQLSVVFSPTASSSQISSASNTLETLKTSLSPAAALQLAQYLLANNPTNSLPFIHYAFHVLDARLMNSSTPWSSFPPELRTAVRTLATSLISSLTDSHPSLLRQKSVSLLVDLALREWPQRWPNFLDQLLQDSIPPLVVCHVLHDLSDRIHVFSDSIQPARRQELRHAMALSLPQTLAYITNAVDTAVSSSSSASTITSVLESLHSFVLWADLRSLFSASVPTACIALLAQKGDTRDVALRVLDAIVSRQFQSTRISADANDADAAAANNPHSVFRDTLFPSILQFIAQHATVTLAFVPFSLVPPAGAMPALCAAFNVPDSPSQILDFVDVDDFAFCVRLLGVLSQLGSTHFVQTFLFSKRAGKAIELSESDAACAAAFVDLLAVAAASPSLALRHAVLPFFTTVASSLVKQTGDAKDEVGKIGKKLVQFILTSLLQAAAVAVLKVNPKTGPAGRFMDLDDLDDVQAVAIAALAPRYAAVAAVASRVIPSVAVEMAMHRLARVLQVRPQEMMSSSNKSDANNDARTLRHRGLVVPVDGSQHGWTFEQFPPGSGVEWKGCAEGSCLFVDAVATGSLTGGNAEAVNTLRSRMAEVFDVVHGTQNSSDLSLISVKPAVLRVLHPLYMCDEGRLGTCVDGLLAMAVALNCENNNREGVVAARLTQRGKILSALSAMLRKLGNAGVKTIGKFWQPLSEYAATALGGRELRAMEKISVMEAALATIMTLDNMGTQIDGVERVLTPVMSFLSSERVWNAMRTPQTLLDFLQSDGFINTNRNAKVGQEVEEVCQMFLMLEAGMHQVVRPVAKVNTPLPLPGILSRAVAPKAVEVSSSLVAAVHSLYASKASELGRLDQDMVGILQPTCREVAYVLNLDTGENMPKGIGELVEHGGSGSGGSEGNEGGGKVEADLDNREEVKPSPGETRSTQVLLANGVSPPDERFARLRERLRDLRRAGYEIMRAAILSGAAESESHLRILITAAFGSTAKAMLEQEKRSKDNSGTIINYNAMEPLHVLLLIVRVVTPLLSYSVCESAGARWMGTAGKLGLNAFLRWVVNLVIGAQRSVDMFGETRVLDLTRESARQMIARTVAGCISAMWPRDEGEEKRDDRSQTQPFIPCALKVDGVRDVIIELWAVVCGGTSDQGAAKIALSTVARAADLAGRQDFPTFVPVVQAALRVAVVFRGGAGGAEEEAGQAAVSALVAVIRKWPQEFGQWVLSVVGRGEQKEKVTSLVQECVAGIIKDSIGTGSSSGFSAARAKKHRVLVRNFVEKLGEAEGVGSGPTDGRNVVHTLPEKLSSMFTKGRRDVTRGHIAAGKGNADSDDVELADCALDSLFGEGDPL